MMQFLQAACHERGKFMECLLILSLQCLQVDTQVILQIRFWIFAIPS